MEKMLWLWVWFNATQRCTVSVAPHTNRKPPSVQYLPGYASSNRSAPLGWDRQTALSNHLPSLASRLQTLFYGLFSEINPKRSTWPAGLVGSINVDQHLGKILKNVLEEDPEIEERELEPADMRLYNKKYLWLRICRENRYKQIKAAFCPATYLYPDSWGDSALSLPSLKACSIVSVNIYVAHLVFYRTNGAWLHLTKISTTLCPSWLTYRPIEMWKKGKWKKEDAINSVCHRTVTEHVMIQVYILALTLGRWRVTCRDLFCFRAWGRVPSIPSIFF